MIFSELVVAVVTGRLDKSVLVCYNEVRGKFKKASGYDG